MEKLESRSSNCGATNSPQAPLIQWHEDERDRMSRNAIDCHHPQLLTRLQVAERFHRDSADLVRQFQQDLLPYHMGHVYE